MRITWLLERTDQLWGGVKVALDDANHLHRNGHRVTVLSRSGPPSWMTIECDFRQVEDFRPEHLPDAEVLIGTLWSTVSWVASAGPSKGVPVHFCQGYEGDFPGNEALRDRIEATYRLPGIRHITIAPHATQLLRERFGLTAHELLHAIDHDVHFPGEPREPQRPLRVGLVGPYQVACKDLATGYAACSMAHQAGQSMTLVRASSVAPADGERDQTFEIEWHQQVPPDRMGDFYRSLDVFLGTSTKEEGFFLPAIEAMACGIPTVLTDVPCFRNHQRLIGHDRYALFVPASDPVAMAEALVLAGSMPNVREALRAGGIEVASHYHLDQHANQLEELLHQLVHEQPRMSAHAAPRLVTDSTPANDDDRVVAELLGELRAVAKTRQTDGDQVQAARLLAAAQCLAPDDPSLLHAAAEAQLSAGQAATALRLYNELASRGYDTDALHQGRGLALHALGRLPEAAQAFRAALAVGSRSADAHNRLGVVLFQAGDVHGARGCFERAVALQPDHRDALANLESLPAA